MYDKLPKWLIKECPKEYVLTEEPGEARDNKIKEIIAENPDLKNLRFGNSFCIHVDKVPMAKSNDIRTFKTFSEAKKLLVKAQQTYPGKNVGLGFGLFRPFCGIDIDHCINEDGVISDTASKIIDMFDGSYIETSLSGTGVHIIFLVPVDEQQKSFKNYFTKMNSEACAANGFSDIGGLEFYQGMYDNRYLTLTGNIIPTVVDHGYTFNKDKIKDFLSTYMFKPQPTTPSTPPVEVDSSDDEDRAWLNWAFLNKRGKLWDLYHKVAPGSGSTESEDDFNLCSELAFFTNKNSELIKSAFMKTDYKGELLYYGTKDAAHIKKWTEKDFRYANMTIDKAIDSQQDVAKNFFKDSFYYDEESKTIKPKTFDEGGNDMRKLEVSTRVSQKGSQVVCLNTKSFKIETAMPQPKKDSTEETVQWVSIYKKGSNEPSVFLDRNKDQALFELASAITLKEFGKED